MDLKGLNLSDQHWHFIGILGTGMQALARYAAECGASITGSDVRPSPAMQELQERGINVRLVQDRTNPQTQADLVVVSQAVADDNPELVKARKLGVDVVRYPELLGLLMELKKGVAVAGSHGKSTTASATAYILREAGLEPSFVIGANVPQLEGGLHCAGGEHLIAEACEYKRSFLYLIPWAGVITNIDLEHLDYYNDLWDIQAAFADFAAQVDPDGFLVINADDENCLAVAEDAECRVVTCGIEDLKADYVAGRLWRAKKHSNFNVLHKGKDVGRFSTQLYGTHNVHNMLAAVATCHELGVEFKNIAGPLSRFEGAARRFQLVGDPWGVAVVSDYAHHPKEVLATIAAAEQRFPGRRLFCVFQPHQHSRTKQMLSEFATCFDRTWVTLITDIYAARDSEEDRRAISGQDLVRAINRRGQLAHYVPEFEDVEDILEGDVLPGDVVLIMGAGSVWEIAYSLCRRIERKAERQVMAA